MDKLKRIVALDVWDRMLWVAETGAGNTTKLSKIHLDGSAEEIEKAPSLVKMGNVYASSESLSHLQAWRRQGIDIKTLPRLLAIYWSFRSGISYAPCLVISIGLDSCVGGLVAGDRLVSQTATSSALSLLAIWRRYINSNSLLKTVFELYERKHADADAVVAKAFLDVAGTGESHTLGPSIPIKSEIEIDSSSEIIGDFIRSIDPDRSARAVILSDWAAANGYLVSLLKKDYDNVHLPERKMAFYQALQGLIQYARRRPSAGQEAVQEEDSHHDEEEKSFNRIDTRELAARLLNSTNSQSEQENLLRIALLTNRIVEGLKKNPAGDQTCGNAFTPYLKVASLAIELERRQMDLAAGSRPLSPSSSLSSLCAPNDRVTPELNAFIRQVDALYKYHRPSFFIDLLEEARNITGLQREVRELKELIGVEQIQLTAGEELLNQEALEVVSVDGLGDRIVIGEVLRNGYIHKESGTILRKPKIKVRLED